MLPLEAVGGHLLTLACSSFWWLPSLPGLSLHHSNLSPWLYCLLFWCLACICITLISVSTVTLFWVNVNVSLPFSYKDMGSIDPVHIWWHLRPTWIIKLDLEKTEEPEIKFPTSVGSLKKQESSRNTSTSALLTMPKSLTVWITTNVWKILKEMGILDHQTCLLRNI